METNAKKVLIGAGVVILLYQAYKMFTKPKTIETKSSATGGNFKKLKEGSLRYDKNSGKVFKLKVDGFDSRWVLLSEAQQPKRLEWYNWNGKPVWVKWNGKFDIV